jgi:hypothetical protein
MAQFQYPNFEPFDRRDWFASAETGFEAKIAAVDRSLSWKAAPKDAIEMADWAVCERSRKAIGLAIAIPVSASDLH